MLEGITVLFKNPITTISEVGIVVLILLFIIAGACMAIALITLNPLWFIPCFIFIILAGTVKSQCYPVLNKETGRYEYKCTISEDVDLQDFEERYEIISHEGDLWVIEDKE